MSEQQEKFERMTTQPVERLILRLAVPTIISMLVTSFYNMADTYFVGQLNTSATAAVGVVFPVMAIIQAFGFFFGHGSGNFVSRALGRQELGPARQMVSTGFFSALIAGTAIMLLGLCIPGQLCRWLGATPTSLPYAESYLRVVLLGAPFTCASFVLNNQLRFQGNAMYAMVGIASGAVLNIGLDPLFIFVFDMGVAGAALATTLSQFISFVLLLIGVRRSDTLKIHLKEFRPTGHNLFEIFRGGVPSLFRQGLASMATILLNLAAGSDAITADHGDAAVAAMSIVSKILMFASSALIGFGQGFQPVCGFNYGAGLYGRVRRSFWFCVRTALIALILLAAAAFVAAPRLLPLFRDDPAVVAIGVHALRLQCLTFPLSAWVIMSNMMLQTIGKATRATVLAAARQGLTFVPVILVLPALFGLEGVLWAQPVADVLAMGIALPLQLTALREMRRQENAPKEENKP